MSSDDEELISAHSDDNDQDGETTTTAATTSNVSSSNRRVNRDALAVHRHRDRVFIFDHDDISHHDITLFSLPHARDATRDIRYALSHGTVFEIQSCRQVASSWFVDENVVRDGTLFLATPIDILFLLLPRLVAVRQSGVFVESTAVFESSEWPAFAKLSEKRLAPVPWHLVCDVKVTGPLTVVRLNDDKLARWLDAKVVVCHDAMKADASLKRFAPTVGSKAVATTFTFSSAEAAAVAAAGSSDSSNYDFLRNAVAYVSEYVTAALANALADRFGVRLAPNASHPLSLAKRMASTTASNAANAATEDILAHVRKQNEKQQKEAAAAAKKTMTLGQKQLAKVDKRGMKPMTSFFSTAKKAKTEE